jgi:hypothetical protein
LLPSPPYRARRVAACGSARSSGNSVEVNLFTRVSQMNVPSGVPALPSLLKYEADPDVKLRLVELRLLGSLDRPADTTC